MPVLLFVYNGAKLSRGGIVIDPVIQKKIDELVEVIRQTTEGKCAIALAGAHAKGTADASSDIDFFVYAEGAKPYEVRKKLICSMADEGTWPWLDKTFDAAPWGGSMDFMYQGTPVEVTARTLAYTEKVVGDCLDGRFQIIPATWTSNGYYTFVYLCELSFVKPVYDPDGVLAALQEKARIYPEKLRQAVMDTFLGRAGTWIGNFHYESAIRRGDLLFCAPIVQHTVLDMVQVIFALNRRYFTGDKKLEAALSNMEYCPKALLDNLEFLLTTPRDSQKLGEQGRILREVYEELREKAKPSPQGEALNKEETI